MEGTVVLKLAGAGYLTAVLSTVCWGCAPQRAALTEAQPVCPEYAATIYVTNHKWAAVTIYVVQASARHRIGRVESVASAVFNIPGALISASDEFVILVESSGVEPFVSPRINMKPGHTVVDMTLENYLQYSTVFVNTEGS